MKSIGYKTIIGILALSVLFSGCNTKSELYLEVPELIKPLEIKYGITKPRIGNITTALRLDGYVMPANTLEMSFESENSKLKEIYVALGQTVRKGELIAEIDTVDINKAIVEKQKYIEKMKTTNDNTYLLKNKRKLILNLELGDLNKQMGIYSTIKESIPGTTIEVLQRNIMLKETEIETLEMDINQGIQSQMLEAKLQQQDMDRLKLRILGNKLYASCSGVVVYVDELQSGDRVTPFKTVVQIADTSQICVGYLGTEVFPNTLLDINLYIGNKTYKGIEVPKTKTNVSVFKTDNNTTTTEPRKIVIKDITQEVVVGQYVSIELVYKEKKDLILVPYNGVVMSGNAPYVYVLENDKKVKRTVKVGLINSTEVEIVEGITIEEDLFINVPSEAYREGSGNVVAVSRGDIVLYSYIQGKTMPSKAQNLYFKYNSARLTALNVSKGTTVKAGDPIASIKLEDNELTVKTRTIEVEAQKKEYNDNKILKLMDIESSEKQLLKLQNDYQRDSSLGVYPKRDLEKQLLQIEIKKINVELLKSSYESYLFEKEYSLKQLEMDLKELEKASSGTTIVAPFDGIITEVTSLKQMQLINKSDRVATLSSKEMPRIKISGINTTDLSYGMPVEISMFKNAFKGKIISCASVLSEGSDAEVEAVIEIEDIGSTEISTNGFTVDLKIAKKQLKDVIVLDLKAVKKYNNKEFVYVLEEGMKKQRYIVTGITDGTHCEILSGLQVGEKVIVD